MSEPTSSWRPAPAGTRATRGLRARSVARALLTLAVWLAAVRPAAAQQFGQWSWEGAFGGAWRDTSNFLGPESAGGYGEARVGGALGVNGFVLHPAIARFRLGLEGALSRYEGGLSRGSREWGFRAGLDTTPQGRVPLTLYAHRRTNAYTELTAADPAVFAGLPDLTTGAGGRLRVTRGRLRGTLAGVDWSRLTYQDAARPATDQEREFLDWGRSGRRFTHRVRLQRQLDDYRFQGYSFEDRNLAYDLHASVRERGAWDWSSYGYRRRFDFQDRPSTADGFRTRQLLTQDLRERDRIELRYEGGIERGTRGELQSHTVEARYTAAVGKNLALYPFLGYGLQSGDAVSVRSPRGGLGAGWTGPWRALTVVGYGDVSYVLLDRSGPAGGGTDSTLAARVEMSARHGDEARLATELEFGWTLNQLRVAGTSDELPPEIAAVRVGPGSETGYRTRLGVRRRMGRLSVGAWGEGRRREPSGSLAPEPYVLDSATGSVQASSHPLDVFAQAGASRLDGPRTERFDYWAAGLSFRPYRAVSLGGSYRWDRRELTLAPSGTGSRIEGRLDVWLGAFQLEGLYFQTLERVPPSPERKNRSVSVTLSRRLGGWLPIVTGIPRGGEIR